MKPVGYSKLIERYGLGVIPNWHESVIGKGRGSRTELSNGSVEEIYPAAYEPADDLGSQLEFALKYDGTNLLILAKLFANVSSESISEYVSTRPTGKYSRRIWYLYELLMATRLPIDDLTQGSYIDLLDLTEYYTSSGIAIRRQRIRDNLLGNARFCPTVRRTKKLEEFERLNLRHEYQKILNDNPPELLRRALTYLYTKETKSSFEIEHIKIDAQRTERFTTLLHRAETNDYVNKAAFVDLQNQLVDNRFRDEDYRHEQNYVGESINWNERIHFVSPRPQDLEALMDGLIASHQRLNEGQTSVIIHAAVIAYGFVFMHPFEDGNGRIHRFLIHHILSCRGFATPGVIFPVSAVMLKHLDQYDRSLEAFSKPLLSLIDYSMDAEGRMTVNNNTADYYRFIDFTSQAESLFEFIRETIDVEWRQELRFLINYDNTKRAIREIVDMPDQRIDQFIRFCAQNNGKLSTQKRNRYFGMLTEDEIHRVEQAVQSSYGNADIDH